MKYLFITLLCALVFFGAYQFTTYSQLDSAKNQVAATTLGMSYGGGMYGKPKCTCPYSIISIGGTGSDSNDSFSRWITKMYPKVKNMPLNNIDRNGNQTDVQSDRIAEIESQIRQELNKTPQKKVLIIAYSLGGSIATNISQKINSPCVEVFTIDPPTTNHDSIPSNQFCRRVGGWVRNDLKHICAAEKSIKTSKDNVNWTDGEASGEDHDPFTTPRSDESQDKIDNLTKRLDEKIRSCRN